MEKKLLKFLAKSLMKSKSYTYGDDVSYVLRIVQCFKCDTNDFVVLKGGSSAVTAVNGCINLFCTSSIDVSHDSYHWNMR